ncbi:lambda-exonuclease family protein [Streptomyces sp. ALI-76-A]|uniref:YqaJ viral recombinase family nuclease n=1 Tax=Streptomyces sp. ALI-76-A TaxID=3025736 RepID=UPI00256ECCE7|nr:YqaJ viral recombinase family protein [Streptomyces sp. ALI-76-A]MDL5205078.1 YqaJ viral recombinase family protein [Streptomyces sp. ALI-76-A]
MPTTAQAGASAPAAGPTVLGWFEPGSDQWHAARANGIGGSEIAAVLGLSPYESRFSLWHRKKGLIGPVEESEEMYWGKEHEPAICRRFARDHPELVVTAAPTYSHPDRPWQIANPDRHAGPDLFEAKTARDDTGWGKEGTSEIPVHYRAQCLHYMDVTGARNCWVGVLIAGSQYREYVVEYDEAEARLLRDAGARFMDDLARDIRPDIDGHSATYQAIREIPDGLDPVDVEIDTSLRDRFYAAQDSAWAAEDELTACKSELLDAIGTGQRAVCERQRIATRTVREGRTYSLMPARTRRNAA